MKKFILPAIVAVAAVSGIFGYFNQPAKQTLNTLALVNLEALTNDDEKHNYEERNETTVSIWDDNTKEYHSITSIICHGKGDIQCP
ncbi:MAG: hypothetical protein HDR97_08105 [Bacteroides sp.]|nr:hypothetical protein [Bacteroides sp.]